MTEAARMAAAVLTVPVLTVPVLTVPVLTVPVLTVPEAAIAGRPRPAGVASWAAYGAWRSCWTVSSLRSARRARGISHPLGMAKYSGCTKRTCCRAGTT
jgi:hypothetical protein